MKAKLAPWLIFAALLCLWLAATAMSAPEPYTPKPYRTPDGEPVSVVEVMRPARWEESK